MGKTRLEGGYTMRFTPILIVLAFAAGVVTLAGNYVMLKLMNKAEQEARR
jgi:hypothetical protein